MKNLLLPTLIIGALPCIMLSCGTAETGVLYLNNELAIERADEPVILTRERITALTGEIPANQVPMITTGANAVLPFQLDDLDGDGEWDELATVLSFGPESEIKISVKLVSGEDVPDFVPATNVRFGVGDGDRLNVKDVSSLQRTTDPRLDSSIFYQMEGPAWENDKVGFRIYFDPRNGIDIFGKTVSDLVMDSVGLKGNYHEMSAWGMDVLKVGNSLGAGSVAIMHNDSLVRLGATALTKFEIVAEGPVRAIFNIHYEGWQVGDENLSISKQISIWKGQYWYKNTVEINGFSEPKEMVTGIVNLYSDSYKELKKDKYVVLSTFDKQSENKDMLGMGLILSAAGFNESGTAPEDGEGITQTFYAKIKALPGVPVSYYFTAAWEQSNEDFKSGEAFNTLLQNYGERLSNPIVVHSPDTR